MIDYKNVILASASPRRQELLKNIFAEFEIIPANIDENAFDEVEISLRPEEIAKAKARHIAAQFPGSLVIGCDTSVIAEGRMLGKPADEEDAVRMLRLLSGREHEVITGVCLVQGDRTRSFSAVTRVKFYELNSADIKEYIATGEWTDKAGAYGIQGAAGIFAEGICGDYNNVVGLPCAQLYREIKEFLGI